MFEDGQSCTQIGGTPQGREASKYLCGFVGSSSRVGSLHEKDELSLRRAVLLKLITQFLNHVMSLHPSVCVPCTANQTTFKITVSRLCHIQAFKPPDFITVARVLITHQQQFK